MGNLPVYSTSITAGKRLSVHTPRRLILALDYAQKLSPSINVELVVGLEVFRHHAERIVSPEFDS
jgi:hypothetical protein